MTYIWYYKNKHAISKTIKQISGKKKEYEASTLISLPDNQCSRVFSINKNNGHLAFKLNSGEIKMLICIMALPYLWNQCLKYSPNRTSLAVKTHNTGV